MKQTDQPRQDMLSQVAELLDLAKSLWQITFACLVGIVSCAVWAASMQWQVADHSTRLHGIEVDSKEHAANIQRMKGHLGITSIQVPHEESTVVWAEEERRSRKEEEEQSTH